MWVSAKQGSMAVAGQGAVWQETATVTVKTCAQWQGVGKHYYKAERKLNPKHFPVAAASPCWRTCMLCLFRRALCAQMKMCPRGRLLSSHYLSLELLLLSKGLEVHSEISKHPAGTSVHYLAYPLLKKLASVWSCICITYMNCKEPFWPLFSYFMALKWVGWRLSNPLFFCIYPQHKVPTLLQQHVTTTSPKVTPNLTSWK